MIGAADIRIFVLEDRPELHDVARGILEEPVKSLRHLVRPDEGRVVDLVFGVALEFGQDKLKEVVFGDGKGHTLEEGVAQGTRELDQRVNTEVDIVLVGEVEEDIDQVERGVFVGAGL